MPVRSSRSWPGRDTDVILASAGRQLNSIPQILLFLFITYKFFSFRPAGVDFNSVGDVSVIRELLMGLAISLAAVVAYLIKRTRICRTVADLQFVFGLMIIVGFLSLLWTPNKSYALYNLLQLTTLVIILSLFDFSTGDDRRREVMRMMNVALAGNLIYLIPVLWSAYSGGSDPGGRAAAGLNYFHPAKMGILAGCLCAYFTAKYLVDTEHPHRNLMFAGITAFALFATGGKGGAAAAAISLMTILTFLVRPKASRVLLLGVLVLAAFPVLQSMDYGLLSHLETYARLSAIPGQEEFPTLVYRFRVWISVIKGFLESSWVFLFGNGVGYSGSQQYEVIVNGQTIRSTGAHQSILQIISESGVIGGGAYLALIATTLAGLIRIRSGGSYAIYTAPLAAGWLTLLICGMIDQVFFFPVNNIFCLFVCLMTALLLLHKTPVVMPTSTTLLK